MKLTAKGIGVESGKEVAIKLEKQGLADDPVVEKEAVVYEALSGGVGMPQMRRLGEQGDFHIMISDLLGPSLGDLFVFCNAQNSSPASQSNDLSH